MLYTVRSYYSLLYGTMSIEEIVEEASKRDIGTLVLADINNSSGCFEFVSLCVKKNIQPVCGIEFRVNGHYLYTCIAINEHGFEEINRHLTGHNLDNNPLSSSAPSFNNVYVIYAPGAVSVPNLRDNEYIGIRPWEASKIISSEYQKHKNKIIAHCPVAFKSVNDFQFHRHLRAIDCNVILDKLTAKDSANQMEYFITPAELKRVYSSNLFLLENSAGIVSGCSFYFDKNRSKNKKTFTGSRYDDKLLLSKLASDGVEQRYGKSKRAIERVNKELHVIDELNLSAYFLITWDIIRYAMYRGYYHVGRGSGGNSIVAYCLNITDIDPIELNLYFERFINPKRTSPPDFDIDFAWTERDQVLDYIFKRYGRNHTALLGTVNTFRNSSVIRELGKVYGLPKNEIDRLTENPGDKTLHNRLTNNIFEYGKRIINFPHYRSIHAGGVLISEEPITCYSALDMPPKGMPTTQFDMYVAEDIGFEKLDILSQRGIAHIEECVRIVAENRKQKIDIHDIAKFKTDKEVNNKLFTGEAVGCFYIESPAMRGLLKKLKCSDYLRLVAASSIIRPGVAKSGMMREYIHRFHNPSSFKYLHSKFEEHLSETFGIMVYQEDVIKIAHHFAGLDLADADILRRAMSGKFRSKKEFERVRQNFFMNCKEREYNDDLIAEVWRQISSFSGYAFCKAHSASYAAESYQSLYLKTYFPHEFHVSVINNFGGFYHTWVYVNEARRNGAKIELPCVNRGKYKTSLSGETLFLGFIHIKGVEALIGKRIEKERDACGEFKSLFDFAERVGPGIEQLQILISCGAFRFIGIPKKELMWKAHMQREQNNNNSNVNRKLFSEPVKEYQLPQLCDTRLEDAWDEIELMGFPVTISRFDMLKTSYRGNIMAADLLKNMGEVVRMAGNLVTTKYVRTTKNEIMQFGCFIDYEGEFFDTVNFPGVLKKYPFTGPGVYLIQGKVTEDFGFPSIEVIKMARLPDKEDPRSR